MVRAHFVSWHCEHIDPARTPIGFESTPDSGNSFEQNGPVSSEVMWERIHNRREAKLLLLRMKRSERLAQRYDEKAAELAQLDATRDSTFAVRKSLAKQRRCYFESCGILPEQRHELKTAIAHVLETGHESVEQIIHTMQTDQRNGSSWVSADGFVV